MRTFANYQALSAALALPVGESGAFRFLPEYGPAEFVCTGPCGLCKPLDIGNGCGTGYARTADNAMICYQCAAADELEALKRDGRGCLYLSGSAPKPRRVTNWTGLLSWPVLGYSFKRRGGGFGADREDFYFTIPGDAFLWHGVVRGDMQLARCKRTKERPVTTWVLYWAPEGREIHRTNARTAQEAIRRTPRPYSKYKGEVYAKPLESANVG